MNAEPDGLATIFRIVATALVPLVAATTPARVAIIRVAESLLRLMKIDGLADNFAEIKENILEGDRLKTATAREDLLAKQIQNRKALLEAVKIANEVKRGSSQIDDEFGATLQEVTRALTQIAVVKNGKLLLDSENLAKIIAPPPASVILLPQPAVSTAHVSETLAATDDSDAVVVKAEDVQQIATGTGFSKSIAYGEGIAVRTQNEPATRSADEIQPDGIDPTPSVGASDVSAPDPITANSNVRLPLGGSASGTVGPRLTTEGGDGLRTEGGNDLTTEG